MIYTDFHAMRFKIGEKLRVTFVDHEYGTLFAQGVLVWISDAMIGLGNTKCAATCNLTIDSITEIEKVPNDK